ncbi:MAG: hypothetical protein GY760_14080 [Deltaproteobacteria bacterium]|nr:hypothetical protein [Deltaproteobacteria bacterium]
MIKKVLDIFSDSIKERTKSPLISSTIFFWILINKVLLFKMFSKHVKHSQFIEYYNSLGWLELYAIPPLLGFIFILFFPKLEILIQNFRYSDILEAKKDKIEYEIKLIDKRKERTEKETEEKIIGSHYKLRQINEDEELLKKKQEQLREGVESFRKEKEEFQEKENLFNKDYSKATENLQKFKIWEKEFEDKKHLFELEKEKFEKEKDDAVFPDDIMLMNENLLLENKSLKERLGITIDENDLEKRDHDLDIEWIKTSDAEQSETIEIRDRVVLSTYNDGLEVVIEGIGDKLLGTKDNKKIFFTEENVFKVIKNIDNYTQDTDNSYFP